MTGKHWKLSLVGTLVLAGLFLSVRLREDATLRNSLVDLGLLRPTRRDEVLVANGTELRGDLTLPRLRKDDGPYRLEGTVRILRGTTVIIEPGTSIAAGEAAVLIVEGTLTGTDVQWFGNHLHPQPRLWHGIVAERGGVIKLTNTRISHASAGIVCGPGGSVALMGGLLSFNGAGVVVLPGSRQCDTDDVRVTDGRVGLHIVGGAPRIRRASFDRVFDAVRVFHEARPTFAQTRVERPGRAAILYAAVPDLVLQGLTLRAGLDRDALIMDGADAPTHFWNGAKHPTGKVVVR